jgi:hypothetical protein
MLCLKTFYTKNSYQLKTVIQHFEHNTFLNRHYAAQWDSNQNNYSELSTVHVKKTANENEQQTTKNSMT